MALTFILSDPAALEPQTRAMGPGAIYKCGLGEHRFGWGGRAPPGRDDSDEVREAARPAARRGRADSEPDRAEPRV